MKRREFIAECSNEDTFLFLFLLFSFFFTEWNNDLLAAFSMHPTTSTTRTCRGEEKREGGGGAGGGEPGRGV